MKYSEMGAKPSRGRRAARRIFLLLVGVVFWIGCGYKLWKLQAESREYTRRMTELEQQIEQEQEKQLEYKEDKRFYTTDEYKEQLARDHFNLMYPGESLIVIE